MMTILIKIIHYLATHLWLPMLLMMLTFILQLAIPILRADSGKATYKPVKNIIRLTLTMTILILAIFQLPAWSGSLIYRCGTDATAVITRSEPTNNMYNEQYIYRYHVLIKGENGQKEEEEFYSSDFNIYPAETIVSYPIVGEEFGIRYLPSDPHVFIILTNTVSAYSKRLHCNQAREAMLEAKIKYEADSLHTDYRRAYAQALQAFVDADCYQDTQLREQYIALDKALIKRLLSTK